jgi:hypothetical protein
MKGARRELTCQFLLLSVHWWDLDLREEVLNLRYERFFLLTSV